MIDGELQKKWGTLCLVSADNLASNALGGFKEGSTANRGCRQCLATIDELKTIFDECHLQLRTPADHEHKCTQLGSAESKREHDELSKEYGINHKSVLDELQYFSVCSGSLVPDVMHDVLESMIVYYHTNFVALLLNLNPIVGMLEYETKELLKHHIDAESYYSLDYLNHQITSMELGYMESRNRPSTISSLTLRSGDHKLKQEGELYM